MFGWLYDIFVAIVSFVMGLFGFDLSKRSVRFEDDVEVVSSKEEAPVEVVSLKEEAPVETSEQDDAK